PPPRPSSGDLDGRGEGPRPGARRPGIPVRGRGRELLDGDARPRGQRVLRPARPAGRLEPRVTGWVGTSGWSGTSGWAGTRKGAGAGTSKQTTMAEPVGALGVD